MNRRGRARQLARARRQENRAERREARQAAPREAARRGPMSQARRSSRTRNVQPRPGVGQQQTQEYVSPYRSQQPANMSNSQYGEAIRRLQEFNQGGTGFGAAALQRAREAGVSDADIKKGIMYGRYNIGQEAFNDLYAKESIGSPNAKTIRRHDGQISAVTGRGVQNWTADTLAHMDERRAAYESTGRDLDRSEAVARERGWQPSSSFADLGDLRWYERTPDDQEYKKAWDINQYYRRLQQQ